MAGVWTEKAKERFIKICLMVQDQRRKDRISERIERNIYGECK